MIQTEKQMLLESLEQFRPSDKNELIAASTSVLHKKQVNILRLSILAKEYFENNNINEIREAVLVEARIVQAKGETFKEKVKDKSYIDDEGKEQILNLEGSIERMNSLIALQDEYAVIVKWNADIVAEGQFIFELLKEREASEAPISEVPIKTSKVTPSKPVKKSKPSSNKNEYAGSKWINFWNIYFLGLSTFSAYTIHMSLKKPMSPALMVELALNIVGVIIVIFAVSWCKKVMAKINE